MKRQTARLLSRESENSGLNSAPHSTRVALTGSKEPMPRDGAIIFGDLVGKLDVLRVSCEKCGRDRHYILARLIRKRGRNAKIIDWIDELTAECPKRVAHNMNDPCGVRCPVLPKVL